MPLEITVQNRVARIKINHNAANTLTTDSFEAFRDTLKKFENDDAVRVVVFIGNDTGYFSNGFDPALFLGKSYEYNHSITQLVNETALYYFFFNKPIIACLNGHAMGAGAVFAVFSDWRFMGHGGRRVGGGKDAGTPTMSSESTRLGFPEAFLGMNFPAFVARYMQDLIGVQQTRDILFGGKSLKAPDALEIGLVDKVYPPAELLAETQKFAEKLAKSPTQVLTGMKRARTEPYRTLFTALTAGDAAKLAEYMTSPVTQEGLRSIVEKRRPRWP